MGRYRGRQVFALSPRTIYKVHAYARANKQRWGAYASDTLSAGIDTIRIMKDRAPAVETLTSLHRIEIPISLSLSLAQAALRSQLTIDQVAEYMLAEMLQDRIDCMNDTTDAKRKPGRPRTPRVQRTYSISAETNEKLKLIATRHAALPTAMARTIVNRVLKRNDILATELAKLGGRPQQAMIGLYDMPEIHVTIREAAEQHGTTASRVVEACIAAVVNKL